MADIIQIRRDTAANWSTANPVLAQGEFGWETDTNQLKLGDGTTAYNALPAFSGNIEFQDTGTPVVSAMAVNFIGATVTDVAGVATVTIPTQAVSSVFGRTGAVVAQNGDYGAGQITYDNSGSGLSAITTQAAIDEIDSRVDTLEAAPGAPVDSVFGRIGAVVAVSGDYNAAQVTYSNTISGLTAVTTQAAIDEIEARVDTLEAAPGAPVDSVFGRTGAVVAVSGDYNAAQVTYSNATSGLTAVTTQAAIDEIEARIDTLEANPSAPVASVFGRTGAVVAVAGDYNATQVTFDDSNVPVTAPNTQSAIQQLYDARGVFESVNTDSTTDLNFPGLTAVPIFGTVRQAGPTGYFTAGTTALTVNVAMRVKVTANLSVTSGGTRVSVSLSATKNGVTEGGKGRGGYIRGSGGHDNSSVHVSTIIDCVVGDTLGLATQQDANSTAALTMIAGDSNFIVEVLELL